MKRPGLTEAMRRALEDIESASVANRKKLHDLGLIRFGTFNGMRVVEVTPRGQAALAAPRMTAAELEILEGVDRGSTSYQYKHQIPALLFNRLRNFDWISLSGDDDVLDIPTVALTKAGNTALNNIRAASGSKEWKP